MRARVTGLTIALLAALALPAAAQTPGGRNELTIFGGISLIDASAVDQVRLSFPDFPRPPEFALLIFPPPFVEASRSLEGSGEFGVRYGRDVTDIIAVEADVSIAPAHDPSGSVSVGCPPEALCIAQPGFPLLPSPIRIDERVVAYHYGGGIRLRVLPGSLRPSVSAGLGGVTYAADRSRQTNLALRVGGALAASMGNLTVQVEVLDAIVMDHFVTDRIEHDVHVRIGLGVRW